MPLFEIDQQSLKQINQTNFDTEKVLQNLVEKNLSVIFNCRLIATEFPTGALHAGRIDTLALSEENNPITIEYKKVESSELINQSLYYLSWINDHRGDFEIAVQNKLGNSINIDWSDIRVICIAPNYRKYDLHAVQVMGANIELWSYRFFENSILYLEEVFRKSCQVTMPGREGESPIKLTAGKKAAITRATGSYTFEEHLRNKPKHIKELALSVQEYVTNLDPSIEESPKKFYVAYRISQNIVCMEIQKQKVVLFLKINPKTIDNMPIIARDVTDIGHFATGDFEINLTSMQDFDIAKPFIEMSYQKVGG